ncbi:MAG TPA: MATE family efflux transporter [Candidatus Limnocylindria bacterium]|nr:MATE family efflux transporter [Candidatus Limnocylindria bacterium]
MAVTDQDELPTEPTARVSELADLSPARAALSLAWPGIVEQLVRAAGQATVFAFIGHLGAVATAAAGASLQFTFLLFPVFQSLSIGTIALVSRRLGEGRRDEAASITRQSLVLGAIMGVVTGVGFAVFAEPLLVLIGAAPDVVKVGAPYLAIIGGFNAFQTISIIGTSAMRAAGDTRTPMLLSLAGTLATLVISYVLIVQLGLGIMGNAYGFVAISAVFSLATFILLWRGRAGLSIAGGPWGLFPATVRSIMSISLPSAAEGVLFSFGLIFIGGLVLRFGTEAFAAHQIVIQLESISFLPCIGFSTAAASLVGQSLGLRDPQRAMRVGWAAARMAMLWTAAVGLLMVLFPALWLSLFTNDPGVIVAGIGSAVIIGLAQPAQAVVFALAGSLRGAGDTRYTLRITAFNWIVVRLPLTVILGAVVGLGLAGVWLALALDYFIRAGLMARRFRSGGWQRLRY